MNTDSSDNPSLGPSPNNVMNSPGNKGKRRSRRGRGKGRKEKKKDHKDELVSCSVCTFAYPTDNSACDICATPNPVAVARYEEMAKEMANEMLRDRNRGGSSREDEELAKAIAAMELKELQDQKDREEENFEASMLLAYQLREDHPPPRLPYLRCSVCTLENLPDRVQCIACGTEICVKERALAPGVVSRKQIALGPLAYDKGGKPDKKLLDPLGFLGKTGNACMVNATAFITEDAQLSPSDLKTLAERVTRDCKANPDKSMWSDLLGVWFQGLDLKINILYGPAKPTGKFQDWASLRKFNPEFRTLIIANTGSHYAVYSPS